ncbi:phage tail length tape measure family protein [Sphingomonas sp. Ant20]|uniref:phage tail length tape measure family protein n=1 Tax=Sphingomonas sp. Ant20 TaxID=104605 RepID=UPI0006905945|nr:phage tail length tape measure family protein [Sphingomonas sp. Ant20]
MIDDDGAASLEVGFILNTEGAFAELLRFGQMFSSETQDFIRNSARIEAAAGGIRLAGATSAVTNFGAAATREGANAAREFARVEKAGEAMARQLERQNSVFGKTREEVRSASAEFKAFAAEQQGLKELAQRIRSEELALVTATDQAAAAAERQAQALRQADQAYQLFESHRRQGLAAWKEVEAAQARVAAEAALNAELLERSRIEAAIARIQGTDRPRATDAGASFSALSAKFAEDEARAARMAAVEVKQLGDEHARLTALVRGSHDAQVADAAAAEQLRMATDPLYASTKKLNAEIAESTRLYHTGATAPAEYARQQEVLTGRLRQSAQAQDDMDRIARKGKGTLTQLSFQLNDVATMAAMGAAPFQIFASQAGQIFQVAQMAEGGVKGFAAEMGGLAVAFLPAIAVASVAGVALYRWKEQINEDAGMKKFAEGLGLTSKEMKKLGDQSITTGDMVAGVWKTITDGLNLGGSGKSLMDYLFSPNDAQQVQGFLASIYGTFTGTYAAIVELWSSISTSVSAYVSAAAAAVAQFFAPVVAAAQWAGNGIAQIFNAIYNRVAGWLKSIGSAISDFAGPILKAMGQSDAATAVTSAGSSLGKAFGKGYAQGAGQVVNGTNRFFATAAENIISKSQERLLKKANEIKADRTPKKAPVDSHAASLVRDSEAIEAQIRNLYKLADAYGVSGAAALIAEARVKAESKAIKQRADIEASVDRQVRLAIAQRVSDVAKSTATAREQAAAQMLVNAQVAAGLVPAARAAELVKDQIADLPLLAAIEAARTRGLTTEAERATKALADQRAARADLTTAERSAQFNTDMAAGNDRLAQMREELRLVGATDMERVRALATLKATQEAQKYNPGDRAAYIEQQVAIAVARSNWSKSRRSSMPSCAPRPTCSTRSTRARSARRRAWPMRSAMSARRSATR